MRTHRQRARWAIVVAVVAVLVGIVGARWWRHVPSEPQELDRRPRAETQSSPDALPAQGRPAQRVVSLIPAVTEMLFAFGAGEQVVAVSSYDRYPDAVNDLPRVGALIDPDVERILSLEPDLVIAYGSQEELQQQLARAEVPVFSYRHGGIGDAVDTMRALGERTGRPEEASRAATRLSTALAAVARRVEDRPRPRTLLVLGREPLALRGIYANAGAGFLHELLTLAGGEDVMGHIPRENVQATTEMILERAPEVIIEIRAGPEPDAATLEQERRVWSRLSAVPAVRTGRIYLFYDDALGVPGPRMPLAAERFARALHPEAFQ